MFSLRDYRSSMVHYLFGTCLQLHRSSPFCLSLLILLPLGSVSLRLVGCKNCSLDHSYEEELAPLWPFFLHFSFPILFLIAYLGVPCPIFLRVYNRGSFPCFFPFLCSRLFGLSKVIFPVSRIKLPFRQLGSLGCVLTCLSFIPFFLEICLFFSPLPSLAFDPCGCMSPP